jgi:hypothetical protein
MAGRQGHYRPCWQSITDVLPHITEDIWVVAQPISFKQQSSSPLAALGSPIGQLIAGREEQQGLARVQRGKKHVGCVSGVAEVEIDADVFD